MEIKGAVKWIASAECVQEDLGTPKFTVNDPTEKKMAEPKGQSFLRFYRNLVEIVFFMSLSSNDHFAANQAANGNDKELSL